MLFVVFESTWLSTELLSEVDFECYLSWPDTLLEVTAFHRCLTLMLFVVAGGTSDRLCLSSMLDFNDICGVPEHLVILLFAFDAWLWCWLLWLEVLLEVIVFSPMLDVDAFLRFWFWCYLLWQDVLLEVIACLRCSNLMLYVVFQSTWLCWCLHLVFDVYFDVWCLIAHLSFYC